MALGVLAGLPSTPNVWISFMAPFWALMRARWEKKWGMFWRTCLLSVFYGGLELFFPYLSMLTVAYIWPSSIVLTIPARPTTVTATVYAAIIVLLSGAQAALVWFDQLGVGDLDGAWLPRSPAKNNWKRENWDRMRSATFQAFCFLFVNQVAQVPLILNPSYLFATWTQHTTNASNDYGMLFGWTVGTAALVTVGLMLTQVMFTDTVYALWYGIWSGQGHKRSKRYGRKEVEETNDDEEEGEDETEDTEA
jgi:hypothetical protein